MSARCLFSCQGTAVFPNLSLKLKLPLILSTVLALVIVALAAAAYHEVRLASVGAASERLQRVSQQLGGLLELSFRAREAEMAVLTARPELEELLRSPDDASARRAAVDLLTESATAEAVVALDLIGADGRRVLEIGGADARPDDFRASVPSEGTVGPLVNHGGRVMYATSAPVGDPDGVSGTLFQWRAVQVDPETVSVLTDLIGVDATIVFGTPGQGWTDLIRVIDEPPLILGEAPSGVTIETYSREATGPVFAGVSRLGATPWYLVVELPEDAVLASAHAFLVRLLVVSPLALLLAALVAWMVGSRLARGVRNTAIAAEAIAAGETGHRVEVYGEDEIGRLATSFNTMAQQVEESRRALEATNASLARSNADLENFAYIASHDLREPLRMVRSYTELLAARYAGQLDEKADQYIHFASDGAQRMEGLINALLAYSRLDGGEAEPTLVDAEETLETVLGMLSPLIDETAAEITHDPLPTLLAGSDQLTHVFQNLVGNAIKFQGEGPPKVHVSSRKEGDFYVFSVKDNGIGIAPEYSSRIFEIFKRLHGMTEFSGTGIGLSICKKIVERNGGEIWVESSEGEGSTFYFSLPGERAA